MALDLGVPPASYLKYVCLSRGGRHAAGKAENYGRSWRWTWHVGAPLTSYLKYE
jgi:hypothetical protein